MHKITNQEDLTVALKRVLEHEVGKLKDLLLSSAEGLTSRISEDSLIIMRNDIVDQIQTVDSLKDKIYNISKT